jgi:hypothetical protein
MDDKNGRKSGTNHILSPTCSMSGVAAADSVPLLAGGTRRASGRTFDDQGVSAVDAGIPLVELHAHASVDAASAGRDTVETVRGDRVSAHTTRRRIGAGILVLSVCIGVAVGVALSQLGSSQPGVAAGAFRTRWDTTRISDGSSNASQVRLPLEPDGEYEFNVQWGDGMSEVVTSDAQGVHTYARHGVYNVSITGTLVGWRFNLNGDRLKLLEVMEWGTVRFGDHGEYFYGAESMVVSARDAPNLSGTTNFAFMFGHANMMSADLDHWDMSGAVILDSMFASASSFNGRVGSWDVSHVVSMDGVFAGATSFNQPIGGWNVSRVIDMEGMFFLAKSFNQSIGMWDVSRVTSMQSMFEVASSFSRDISSWCVSQIGSKPSAFDKDTSSDWTLSQKPRWGECPNRP